jgi:hypothetical protein
MADNVIPGWIRFGSVVLAAALVVDFAVVFYNAINAAH